MHRARRLKFGASPAMSLRPHFPLVPPSPPPFPLPIALRCAVRSGGASGCLDALMRFFMMSEMIVPCANYLTVGIGLRPGDVDRDVEGLQIMHTLGKNMALSGARTREPGMCGKRRSEGPRPALPRTDDCKRCSSPTSTTCNRISSCERSLLSASQLLCEMRPYSRSSL